MKTTIAAAVLAAGFAAAFAAAPARADTFTVTFEDTAGVATAALGQYAGFGWSFSDASGTRHIAAIDVPDWIPGNFAGWYAGVGCATTAAPRSGCTGAYNMFLGSPSAISRPEAFILNRLDLTSSLGNQTLEVSGYKAGGLKLSRTLTLGETRQTIRFDWHDIDELRLVSAPGANQWVLDNLEYTLPVPEPAQTWQLLAGLALLAVGAAVRRRR